MFVAGNLLAIRAGGGRQDHLDHEAVHASHLPSLLPHLQDTRQGNLTVEKWQKAWNKITVQKNRPNFNVVGAPPREYWMIYRGPGFLAVVWFGSSPSLPSSSTGDTQADWERETAGWGGGGGRESLVLYKSFNNLWPRPPKRLPVLFLLSKYQIEARRLMGVETRWRQL